MIWYGGGGRSQCVRRTAVPRLSPLWLQPRRRSQQYDDSHQPKTRLDNKISYFIYVGSF